MKINLNEVRQMIRKEIVLGLVKEAVEKAYLSEQNQSRDERNMELIRQYKAGDPSALNQFVQDNSGLVATIARQFSKKSGVEFDDLMQAGYEGLLRGIEKFDAERENANISATLQGWIRSMIAQQLELTRPVSVKGKGGRDIRKVKTGFNKAFNKLRSELGRDPSDEEVAAELGVDVETMRSVRSVGGVSANMPVGEEGGMTIGDTIVADTANPEETLLQKDFVDLLSRFEDNLSKTADKYAVKVLKGEMTNQQAADAVAEEEGKNYSRQALNLRVKQMKNALMNFLGDEAFEYSDFLEKNAAA